MILMGGQGMIKYNQGKKECILYILYICNMYILLYRDAYNMRNGDAKYMI